MPLYEFQCECGLLFEELFPRVKSVTDHPCPACGAQAPKVVSPVSHTFAHKVVGGPRPQNTGVHAIDYSADAVIGRDAEARWHAHEAREKAKVAATRDAARALGVKVESKDQLVREGPVSEPSYRVVQEGERQGINASRVAAHTVTSEISKKIRAGAS